MGGERDTERETAAEFIAHVRIPVLSVGGGRNLYSPPPSLPPLKLEEGLLWRISNGFNRTQEGNGRRRGGEHISCVFPPPLNVPQGRVPCPCPSPTLPPFLYPYLIWRRRRYVTHCPLSLSLSLALSCSPSRDAFAADPPPSRSLRDCNANSDKTPSLLTSPFQRFRTRARIC